MNEIMTVLDDEQKQAFRPVPIELRRAGSERSTIR